MHGSDRFEREEGFTLLEMTIALTLLTVGILSLMSVFYSTQSGVGSVEQIDRTSVAFENMVEQMKSFPLDEMYNRFNGAQVEIPGLLDPDGTTARLQVTCFVNESAIPLEFGPLADIDGTPGSVSNNCSTTYRVLPVRMRVDYQTNQGPQRREVYLTLDGE